MSHSVRVRRSADLDSQELTAVRDLCSAAYEEDFAPYLALFDNPVHILVEEDGRLVSHALWIARTLQADHRLQLRTAYVEAVATLPSAQGRGLASAVMARLAAEIQDFDLGALSPSDHRFYARFGWELWQGPLLVRTAAGEEPAPEEEAMILRLPGTPPLDLTWPLSVEWRPIEPW